ncbi:MAG: GntR family transcriptional regulator [Comamonadaceae bacterium]|nr:GntR family transcriptional regulator [Comamonadaceae bacterium]
MQITPEPIAGSDTESGELSVVPAASMAPAFSPLYQQIKRLILNSLRAGEWKPGEGIPSEMDLATRYRVSQGTVRKAIDELAAENLLLRRQGKGTFVTTHAEQQVQFRFLKLEPDSGTRGSSGPAHRNIIECRRARASMDVAKALGLRTGETVLQVRRVLSFGGTPIILEDIWLPAVPFRGLTAERLANYQGPMYALFETEFNVRMVRAEEKIRAIPSLKMHESLLNVKQGTALLSVERVAYTYRDEPMELRKGYYRTDTHHYHNALN